MRGIACTIPAQSSASTASADSAASAPRVATALAKEGVTPCDAEAANDRRCRKEGNAPLARAQIAAAVHAVVALAARRAVVAGMAPSSRALIRTLHHAAVHD